MSDDRDIPLPGSADANGRMNPDFPPPEREPMFNLPVIVVYFGILLISIHIVRSLLLSEDANIWTIYLFAFIPARYGELAGQLPLPAAAIWSPLSYALLHGDWTHLAVNILWMTAFGSPLARRIGTMRFVRISVLTALGGALAHFLSYPAAFAPVVGASAIVSGFMGAAARFAFQTKGPGLLNVKGPALSLTESFTNRKFLIFLLVWFALNFLFGSGAVQIAGSGAPVAWQAHIGGFVVGVLLFSLLDRNSSK
jgi:membrane associated rhomboid family serine protease